MIIRMIIKLRFLFLSPSTTHAKISTNVDRKKKKRRRKKREERNEENQRIGSRSAAAGTRGRNTAK
jgi:hypothetical protein